MYTVGVVWSVNVWGSVHGRKVDTGKVKFFLLVIEIDQQKQPKVTCSIRY